MRKFLYIAIAFVAATLVGTGCNNYDSKTYYGSIVTLLDGSYDYAYSAEFDDGKKVYITNSFEHPFTFGENMNGEGRAHIWYMVEDQTQTGFDHTITLASPPTTIPTFKLITINDSEVKDLDKFTAPAHITEMAYAKNRNYLTVRYNFLATIRPTGGYQYPHQLQLLYNNNPEHEGAYQEYYPATDDGYLYLELYHNSNGDGGNTNVQDVASYKVDYGSLHGMPNIDTFKGIKVIQTVDSGRPEIFTYNFPKAK